ncbi:hypothetical protein Acr_03g0003160 [Actinidia rufa]|uniref:Hydroxyacylglutathione hydrolase C-terminal domain-containing protein n=1 Tax=Actinidia rufa TaxID=165716 RepID=A0A7J0EB75_9ERIC|nr:hypothetical protein Acr_03g0003160 [Actinidia rufa]
MPVLRTTCTSPRDARLLHLRYASFHLPRLSLHKAPRVRLSLHKYTVKNLQFALTVEPDNVRIGQKLSLAQQKRQTGLPTVPSTIEEELETNPFMRVDLPEVQVLFSLVTVTYPGVCKDEGFVWIPDLVREKERK